MIINKIILTILYVFTVFTYPFSVYAIETQQSINAVVTGNPLATKAGLDVLEKGGNAFDAAVAVAATLNVVDPALSGIGGYGSTLVYDAQKKEIRFLNSIAKFPQKTNSDLMREPTANYMQKRVGPKSIGIPGNLNGWKEMHSRYGRLPWRNLFESAIKYAKNGLRVDPFTAKVINLYYNDFSDYSKSIYGKNERPLKEGEVLIQKDLAKTYELIAAEGIAPFYRGKIALAINSQLKELGGFLSIEDLRNYVAEWWDPIKIEYKGYDIYTIGTPGNGFSALLTLGIMNQFPLEKMNNNSEEYLHLLLETTKESCKVRLTHSGSPEAKNQILNNILTDNNFASIAESIDTTKSSDFSIQSSAEGQDTTHFVIVDKWGNIVSSTQTLGCGFGSKIMIEGTGVWMNTSMAYATFEPKGNPMDVIPGKYHLSSMSPIIILKDNKPWAALGTPGGHTIPQNISQVIINLIDFNMNMQEAVDAPKVAFLYEKNVVQSESSVNKRVISSLKEKGHNIIYGDIGNTMGIKFLYDKANISFDVGIDKRRDGWSKTNISSYDNIGVFCGLVV